MTTPTATTTTDRTTDRAIDRAFAATFRPEAYQQAPLPYTPGMRGVCLVTVDDASGPAECICLGTAIGRATAEATFGPTLAAEAAEHHTALRLALALRR